MRRRFELALFLYEKVVIALVIAVISAALLYTYNAYSKAFEVAQAQSRGYSTLASRLRELAVTNTIKATQNIRSAYNKSESSDVALPKEIADYTDDLSLEIERISRLLTDQLEKTTAIAQQISRALKEAVVVFTNEVTFTKNEIERLDRQIADLQSKFIGHYNEEIDDLIISEFSRFFARFEQEIPFYARPTFLIWACLLIFLICTVGLVLFWTYENKIPRSLVTKNRSNKGLDRRRK